MSHPAVNVGFPAKLLIIMCVHLALRVGVSVSGKMYPVRHVRRLLLRNSTDWEVSAWRKSWPGRVVVEQTARKCLDVVQKGCGRST